MPGGARANRLTRAVSIVIAGRTGEEIHTITVPEMPTHSHPASESPHTHSFGIETDYGSHGANTVLAPSGSGNVQHTISTSGPSTSGIGIGNAGGGQAHENLQPTVFVPYIVKLDD
jgi:microcystin-dependent protein